MEIQTLYRFCCLGPSAQSNTYQTSFYPRTIREWNKLPTHIIECNNLQSFLSQLQSYKTESLLSLHDKNIIRIWLCRFSKETGVELHFKFTTLKRVYRQCSKVALNTQRLRKLESHQEECHLDKDWRMRISSNDVKTNNRLKNNTYIQSYTRNH